MGWEHLEFSTLASNILRVESCPSKLIEHLKTLNVVVGTQIERTNENQKTLNLANRIKRAIQNNESEFIFGLEGKIIYLLYRISPLLCNSLIYIKRLLFK